MAERRKWPRFRIRLPWVFVAIAVALLSVMLVIAGLVSAGIVSDNLTRDNGGDSAVPTSVAKGGVFVDMTGSQVAVRDMPDRTIALTFDDGPDPTWTPQILSILRKY